MRRRRYRKPRVKNVNGYRIAQYRDLGGRKRKVSLGPLKVRESGKLRRNSTRFWNRLTPEGMSRHPTCVLVRSLGRSFSLSTNGSGRDQLPSQTRKGCSITSS